jgi:hypothetical protein
MHFPYIPSNSPLKLAQKRVKIQSFYENRCRRQASIWSISTSDRGRSLEAGQKIPPDNYYLCMQLIPAEKHVRSYKTGKKNPVFFPKNTDFAGNLKLWKELRKYF